MGSGGGESWRHSPSHRLPHSRHLVSGREAAAASCPLLDPDSHQPPGPGGQARAHVQVAGSAPTRSATPGLHSGRTGPVCQLRPSSQPRSKCPGAPTCHRRNPGGGVNSQGSASASAAPSGLLEPETCPSRDRGPSSEVTACTRTLSAQGQARPCWVSIFRQGRAPALSPWTLAPGRSQVQEPQGHNQKQTRTALGDTQPFIQTFHARPEGRLSTLQDAGLPRLSWNYPCQQSTYEKNEGRGMRTPVVVGGTGNHPAPPPQRTPLGNTSHPKWPPTGQNPRAGAHAPEKALTSDQWRVGAVSRSYSPVERLQVKSPPGRSSVRPSCLSLGCSSSPSPCQSKGA
ncbi:uncharacterized protein LOC119525354 [Choloepus didactylus]|uniref:uncharacterized protein LOC119525354 n=1 Tax=Choloepus didactylus TaxID=27675 RepID=UPI00189E5253|nr:uncharacterized protein LOC119525354 [Choloepus didactylus]